MQRVALLACSITSVSVWALKRALFGSLRSGRHGTGDWYIRQKYGSICAALWTCPGCSVFTALFIHITIRSILQEDRGQTHTFLLNTNFGSRTPQLPTVTTCYRRGRKPCVCCSSPFCFLDSLQTCTLLEEDTHDGVTALLLEGKHNLWLVGCGSLLA